MGTGLTSSSETWVTWVKELLISHYSLVRGLSLSKMKLAIWSMRKCLSGKFVCMWLMEIVFS